MTEKRGGSNKQRRGNKGRWKRREARLVRSRLVLLYVVTAQMLKLLGNNKAA